MRFTVTKTPSGYQILEAGIAEPIAILQSESCALRACEELNRGIVESKDIAPYGRWTEIETA